MSKTAIVSLVKVEATLQKAKFNNFLRIHVFDAITTKTNFEHRQNLILYRFLLPQRRPLEQCTTAKKGKQQWFKISQKGWALKGETYYYFKDRTTQLQIKMKRKSWSYPHSVRKSLKNLGLRSNYHLYKLPGQRKPFLVEVKRMYGVPAYNLPSLLLTLLKGPAPTPHPLSPVFCHLYHSHLNQAPQLPWPQECQCPIL